MTECPGPLVWYEVEPHGAEPPMGSAAILVCSTCGYIVITGGWNDAAHSTTPILREGYVT